jgi:hypothetical protein
MAATFAKLPELRRKLSTVPGAFDSTSQVAPAPRPGCAGLSVEKEATMQMASFCCCQSSLMTTLITILDS